VNLPQAGSFRIGPLGTLPILIQQKGHPLGDQADIEVLEMSMKVGLMFAPLHLTPLWFSQNPSSVSNKQICIWTP